MKYMKSFFTATRLAWQAALKKTKLTLDLLTDIDMLLMKNVEKCRKTCQRKNMSHNKESSYLKYQDVNNIYGWTMSQKLAVNDSA